MSKTGFYVKFYSRAARNLGLKYEVLSKFTIDIFSKNNQVRFFGALCSKNDGVAHIIAKHKHLTNYFLTKHKLPVLQQKKFYSQSLNEINKFIKIIKYPVVVKPTSGLCGQGIRVNITNSKELKIAITEARKINKNYLIEKYYSGWDYRLLICTNKLLAVTKRFPASVTGDSKSNINQLINKKNKTLPKNINIDQEIRDKLIEQRLTLKSVLANNKTIFLRYRSNAALGGTTENIDPKTVHPDNIKVCMKAVEVMDLQLAGLDFMTTDITKSYKKTGAGITEINDNPATDIHSSATMNPIKDIAEQVLKLLLKIKK